MSKSIITDIITRNVWSSGLRKVYFYLREIPLINLFVQKFLHYFFPYGSRCWVKVNYDDDNELYLVLDPRYEDTYLSGNYEKDIYKLLKEYLEPGNVFYDVGAHIGYFSLVAANIVGTYGNVYTFDPDPDNVNILQQQIQKNKMFQIKSLQLAVWSQQGNYNFSRASSFSSKNTGSITTDQENLTSNLIEVETIKLDDFAKLNKNPNLIKIDVEGGEFEVLKGASEIFVNSRPFLICEIHNSEVDTNVRKWLKSKKYLVENLKNNNDYPIHIFAQPID